MIIKSSTFHLMLTIPVMMFILSCGWYPQGPKLHYSKPEEAGIIPEKLYKVEEVIKNAIDQGETPGAVLLVARKGRIAYFNSFGYAQITPEKEPMTRDQIFDMASVTKPVATASSIMLLVERGQIRLMDPVEKYIPEFTRYIDENGKKSSPVRIYHLLTHTSGLPPYMNAAEIEAKYGRPCPDSLIREIARIRKLSPPGEIFRYSCLGYITLAEIIYRITGETIDTFSRRNLFLPMGMRNTMFCPPEELRHLIAPTEVIDGKPLRGTVHDPLAQLMDGKSGNAGLFSCAKDLAIFAQMMLNKGTYGKTRVFSPATVNAMIRPYPGLEFAGRGIGWDLYSDYSSNQGDLFFKETYGHTGFTGTSMVIDPVTKTIIILLTNRVHLPDASVIRLRSLVSNIVAASISNLD